MSTIVASTTTPTVVASTASPAPTAQNKRSEPDTRKPLTSIWTSQEVDILRQHIEGYKAEAKERRGKYVAKKVYALIKALWAERYNEENMTKEKGRKEEWKKKKSVCSVFAEMLISYIYVVGNLQLVSKPCKNGT